MSDPELAATLVRRMTRVSPSTLQWLVQDFDELVAAGFLQDTLSDAATFLCAYLDYEEEHEGELKRTFTHD